MCVTTTSLLYNIVGKSTNLEWELSLSSLLDHLLILLCTCLLVRMCFISCVISIVSGKVACTVWGRSFKGDESGPQLSLGGECWVRVAMLGGDAQVDESALT